MATTTAAAAGAATAAPPLPLSTTTIRIDDASPSSSPSLGCPSLRGFFDAVDSGLRFLEREAADAEKTAALDEARAHVSLVGDGASKTTATTTQPTSTQTEQPKRCSRRAPTPGWAWVADHLLSLVQQYSSGLSEPVMRTSLWQAWRQLVRRFFFEGFEFFSFFGFFLLLTPTSTSTPEKKNIKSPPTASRPRSCAGQHFPRCSSPQPRTRCLALRLEARIQSA